MLLNPAGNVVSYFGSYISGSLLNVFLEEQRHTIFELETFSSGRCAQSMVEIYHGKIGILLFGQRCSEIDLHSCKCFDIPEYHSGCRLCRLECKCFSLIGLQSCQPQQPSRSTIPLRFSPICLSDAERFELVLPAHLSQWGFNGCTDFGET